MMMATQPGQFRWLSRFVRFLAGELLKVDVFRYLADFANTLLRSLRPRVDSPAGWAIQGGDLCDRVHGLSTALTSLDS